MPVYRSRRQVLTAGLTLGGVLLARPAAVAPARLPEVTVHASPT